ncbi:MAG: cobyrinic acid a,c-diamide synthase, partial [Actinomycetota bacterium]|nr:cobyrinic acid a,c-diamide synthase [Actinomycetota bacterium]
MVRTPRIVIAGTHSGVGKTTVASGLMAALRTRGYKVAPFKVGPDFIDPSYHAIAAGRPGRNLDAFLSGSALIAPLFAHGAKGADVAVVEGVMGLFDGKNGDGEFASTAHVAKLLHAPVFLVVDAGAMARSAAALVHGYTTFDPGLRVAGVILN